METSIGLYILLNTVLYAGTLAFVWFKDKEGMQEYLKELTNPPGPPMLSAVVAAVVISLGFIPLAIYTMIQGDK